MMLAVSQSDAVVYQNPNQHSKIEDILRYGTLVRADEVDCEWILDRRFNGWILRSRLSEVEEDPHLTANAVVDFRGAYVFAFPDTEWGPMLSLPFEAPIVVIAELSDQNNRWVRVRLIDGREGYVQRSHLLFSRSKMGMREMVLFSKRFLGTRYLWGGTSSFGYDCSGFVQMLYRQMGIELKRNARDQIHDPRFFHSLGAGAQEGDLVFFSDKTGQTVHVGMMIDRENFIHAFTKQEAWVCISSLKDERFANGVFYNCVTLKRLLT